MASNATFVAYIDEAGDEGFKFGSGSSEWFVLAAAVYRRSEEVAEVKVVNTVRDRINQGRKPGQEIPPRKPLHFRDLRHEQRKYYAAQIAQSRVRSLFHLVHKPSLEPDNKVEIKAWQKFLYTISVLHLAERIALCCHQETTVTDEGDGTCDLILSNRATMDYDALRRFMTEFIGPDSALGQFQNPGHVIQAEQIETYQHGQRMGLQIADAIASSHYFALEKDGYGMTEDGYATLLAPCLYCEDGEPMDSGLTIGSASPEIREALQKKVARWRDP
jgi:hypothetical protein